MQRYNDKKNERKGRSNMKTFRLRCKKLCAVVLMIQMDIGLRSSLRNSILKDILCFRYFYKKKQIQVFGRDSIPRSLLESASFIMILYFPAIFQILSAVFQKCFISFFHFIDIRFACDLPWCMHA